MDVWWNNHFLCNDLESSSWNNHKKTGCLEFQEGVKGSALSHRIRKIGRNSNCPHFLHVGSKASPRCWLATVEFLWAITIRIYKKRLRRHFGWISITQVFLKWGKRLWQNKQPTHSDQLKIRVLVLGDSKRRPVVFWADRCGGPSFSRENFHNKTNFWKCAIGKENSMVIPPCGISWERRDPFWTVPTDLVFREENGRSRNIHWSCMVTRWWFQTCSGIFYPIGYDSIWLNKSFFKHWVSTITISLVPSVRPLALNSWSLKACLTLVFLI